MKVEREFLLRRLEAVAPGLATKEALPQSSCFVFSGGRVQTYNDEVHCSIDCDIGVTGAVAAAPLLALLQKLTEPEVTVVLDVAKGGLLVGGKGRRSAVAVEEEVVLPVDAVPVPKQWDDLDPTFSDAVGVVQHCASKDTDHFHLTCIHVTPDHVEACDNFQLARYPVKTGVDRACLVKRDSLKHVATLGMVAVACTDSWLHFRNPIGLVLSVRREFETYTDITPFLTMDGGDPVQLPGGLAEAVDKAEIFSADNAENNVVQVDLRPGWLRLRGAGPNGWYEERKKVKYAGQPLRFVIAPKLLVGLTAKSNQCTVVPGRLKVDSGRFTYVTCLGVVD